MEKGIQLKTETGLTTTEQKNCLAVLEAAKGVRTINQALDFGNSFGSMVREVGETVPSFIMAIYINELLQDLNLSNTMDAGQIERASDLLIRKFNNLNPADVKLCFDKMRLGEYGEYYNRMDVQILAKCLTAYFEDRLEAAEHLSTTEHIERKADPVNIDLAKYGGIKGWYEHNMRVQKDLEAAAKKDREEREKLLAEQARKKAEEFKRLVEEEAKKK